MLRWLFKNFQNPENAQQVKPKTLGQLGEEFARAEYKQRGYKIIAANFFNQKGLRLGEIDFIAADNAKIIFVEVKTRTSGGGRYGSAAEAVSIFKQKKILKAAKIFLLNHPKLRALVPQIDVCLVEFDPVDKRFKPAKILSNAVEDWN